MNKVLTVKDLINLLKKHPNNYPVFMRDKYVHTLNPVVDVKYSHVTSYTKSGKTFIDVNRYTAVDDKSDIPNEHRLHGILIDFQK